MSTLTAKQVGDLMTMYAARPCPVVEAIPRQGRNGNVALFDRGHYRRFSTNNVQEDASGSFANIQGEKIYVTRQGVGLYVPVGFYPVPERVILKHFATDALVNSYKLENAILDYKRAFDSWYANQPRQNSRPRRPTLQMLRLRRGSEFENFLKPLISSYLSRLKDGFDHCLNLIEQQDDVFQAVNKMYVPDTRQDGSTYDSAVDDRWNRAVAGQQHMYIYVRMNNFTGLSEMPDVAEPVPPLLPPFPNEPNPNVPPPPNVPPQPSDKDKDEELLGKGVTMGKAFKNDFLGMDPWMPCSRKSNPFRSNEYRAAWDLAQDHFHDRYENFKNSIEHRRMRHKQQWVAYKSYQNALDAYAYTKIVPNVPFAERPPMENFDNEWKEFIFGMRLEMKHVKFDPVPRGNDLDSDDTPVDESDIDIMLRPRMLMI